ncbi:DUF1131 family protein [Shigella flexneri]
MRDAAATGRLFTSSSVNWSAANPWNWFGSSPKSQSRASVINGATPLQEQAIADALDGDYRLRSGMKTATARGALL